MGEADSRNSEISAVDTVSKTVLITGATGVLGTSLLAHPSARANRLRGMSHRAVAATASASSVQWVRADLATGDGLDAALDGIEVIIHAATDSRDGWRVDVEGTDRLTDAAQRANVKHLVYVSIVGIDRIPFAYYQIKTYAEQLVHGNRVPYSIVRGTQFHDFIDTLARKMARFPIAFAPAGFRSQPIHVGEFAGALWDRVAAGPVGRARDVAGPEVLSMRRMVRSWLAAQHRRAIVIPIPLPGRLAAAMRDGEATAPAHAVGQLTWDAWLQQRYGGAPPSLSQR